MKWPQIGVTLEDSGLEARAEFRSKSFIILKATWLTRPSLRGSVYHLCSGKSHQSPSGLLQPLPVPSHPWSHVALDFVTGLPKSEGNDTMLTIVDRFSKSAHYVVLPKLPTASETVDPIVQHAFRPHGIPVDIVSNRGPQFISRVWKEFCSRRFC